MTTDRASSSLANAQDIDELSRLVLETSAERVDLVDVAGRLVGINAIGRHALEDERCAFCLGCAWEALWSESSREAVHDALAQAALGHSASFEAATTKSAREWQVSVCPVRDACGRPARVLAVARDASHLPDDADQRLCEYEKEHALERLRLSEERLRLALAGAALGTWHWDIRTSKLRWSDLSFAMFGLRPRPYLTYEEFAAAVYPADRARVEETAQRAIREHTEYECEFRIVWPDHSLHWVGTRGRAFYDAQQTPVRMEGIAQDVTEHKLAERALLESEERFRQLADAIPHLVCQIEADGKLSYANQRWVDFFHRDTLDAAGWTELIYPDDWSRVRNTWNTCDHRSPNADSLRLRRYDGRLLWFACRGVPVCDAEGRLLHILVTATEIENLKQTEAALRESQARLDTALRAAGMGTWVWDLDTDRVQLDASLSQLFGYERGVSATLTLDQVVNLVHADDRPLARTALEHARSHRSDLEAECRVLRGDGSQMWLTSKGRREPDPSGRTTQVFGASVDVTQHKRLEEDLRQAQKMEAIGQLAGGVAHDFNNLLMVILGQASLISTYPGIAEPTDEALREIVAAGERAASLTAQLLAFGRRQTLQVKELALNEVVASVGQMLRRLLGENVVLEIESGAASPRLRADPNALVQVLLNLALNARDAMPAGGRLTIRTGRAVLDERARQTHPEARPGSWACLSVSDTGEGIPKDVLPRIFEPFFTTKELGKGTGLGLATVYGIVKQHRGFMTVDSTLGHGTTFTAFLPLPPREAAVSEPAAPARAVGGRKELVLLVEDDPYVRATTSKLLEQYNYRLLVVDDAVQALEVFALRGREIDLLLSDVVLPRGLSGAELAEQLRHQNPELCVILCSGYSADKISHEAESLPDTTFLQKPYRTEQLLVCMRSLLDKRAAAPVAAVVAT